MLLGNDKAPVMTSDIHLAFAHPNERSHATARDLPLDRISVRNHVVDVEIGAFQAERGVSQRISFNIVVEVLPLTGDIDDDVDRILSYDKVTEAIAFALAEERLNLLETLAERVAEIILIEPQAVRVFVRIEKLDRGPATLGVEIMRTNDDGAAPIAAQDVPHPALVYLSNEAIASPLLKGWIDQLETSGRPLIFCVGTPEHAGMRVDHKMAQRRIDLLSIEQNAWHLASKDKRCVVVATRTELDWAMKNGQSCVWAPSKIVLDAAHGPSSESEDAVTLAAWFAATFDAQEMLVIGADLPSGASVPLRAVSAQSVTL